MTPMSFSRPLGLVVGSLLLIFGAIECTVSMVNRDPVFFFWFPSLIGGGALVLLGTFKAGTHPRMSLAALLIGLVLGSLATAWTILIPLLAVVLAVRRVYEATGDHPAVS